MNSISLQIFVTSLSEFSEDDGVYGECYFKFYDRKAEQMRALNYRAYGKPADTLYGAGVNSSFVITGEIHQYKPLEGALNPTLVLDIKTALSLRSFPQELEQTEEDFETEEEQQETTIEVSY